MTIALLAAKLITVFEGFRATAYKPVPNDPWTIGFGHTAGVSEGMACTFDEAVVWLAQDSAPLIELVSDRPALEAAALVSFGYNCGIGALRRVLTGDIQITSDRFLVGGQPYGESSHGNPVSGLAARRGLEAALIETSRGM